MLKQIEGKIVEIKGKYIEVDDVAELLGVTYTSVITKASNGTIQGALKYKTLIPLDYVLGKLYELELKKKPM